MEKLLEKDKYYNVLNKKVDDLIAASDKVEIALYQIRAKLLEIQDTIFSLAKNSDIVTLEHEPFPKPYVEAWYKDNVLNILVYDLPPNQKKLHGTFGYENSWSNNIMKAICSLEPQPYFDQKCFCWIEFYCPKNTNIIFDVNNRFVGALINALCMSHAIPDDNFKQLAVGLIGFEAESPMYKTYAKVAPITDIYKIISTSPSREIEQKTPPFIKEEQTFW